MSSFKSRKTSSQQESLEACTFAKSIVKPLAQPLLFLNQGQFVVKAKPFFYLKFQVNEAETEGRNIYNPGQYRMNILALHGLLENIILENEQFQVSEKEHDFPDIGYRIMHLDAFRIPLKGVRKSLILLAIDKLPIGTIHDPRPLNPPF